MVRSLVVFTAVLLAIAGLGATRGQLQLGVLGGLVGGAGAGLALAFARVRRGPLALPPLIAVVGVVVVAVAVVAVLRPAAVFVPRWILPGMSSADAAGGDRVLFAANLEPAQREQVAAAVADYRGAFAQLLGVWELPGCAVDVVVADEASYALLAAAAQRDDGAFGFAHKPPMGRITVVHRLGAGWGSLTHHLALLYVPCALPQAPDWVVVGTAALVEKHLLRAGSDGRKAFSLEHRSNWRMPEALDAATMRAGTPRRDLRLELARAEDQGFLRAFFLFLHAGGWLSPVLQLVRDGQQASVALANVTGADAVALEQQWRDWLHTESIHLPVLEAATPGATFPQL